MPKDHRFAAYRRCGAATALLRVAANCTQSSWTSSAAIPPSPAGDARLWFFRDSRPRETQTSPCLRLNGQIVGISQHNGAFYRDVAPGHYAVTIHRYLSTDFGQFADIDLTVGQEAHVKVLAQGHWVGGQRADLENFLHSSDP
jgi:hypothetical protein